MHGVNESNVIKKSLNLMLESHLAYTRPDGTPEATSGETFQDWESLKLHLHLPLHTGVRVKHGLW